MINCQIIVFCSFVYLFTCQIDGKVHEYMTHDELNQIFDSSETIPKYETVKMLHDKSDGFLRKNFSKLIFNAFGEKKIVELKPHNSTVIGSTTPIWIVKYNSIESQLTFDRLDPKALESEVTLYETSDGSIIGSSTDANGIPYFAGSVGNLSISPAPSRIAEKIYRRRRHISQDKSLIEDVDLSGNYVLTDYHIIYNNPRSFDSPLRSATIKVENLIDRLIQENGSVRLRKSKREIPDRNTTIYPEILLFTDYDSLVMEGGGPVFSKFIIYLIAFWNNVALHFKTLKNPQVSLRITGIVIGTVNQAIPFLSNHKSPDGRIIVKNALSEMSDWLTHHQNVFPIHTYDFAIAMTNKNLCEMDSKLKKYKPGITLGMANIGAKCAFNTSHVDMCAIIHDELDFTGVLTATHELAHIMGAQHDGLITESTRNCNSHKIFLHYIMTPFITDIPQNFIWSPCSRQTISSLWHQNPNTCLNINSTIQTGKSVSIILPGIVTSLKQQCIDRGYSHACTPTNNTCNKLECWTDNYRGLYTGWRCHRSGPPLDGSVCGPGRRCILGLCRNWNE